MSQDVDPVEGAKLAVQPVAGMEQGLAKLASLEKARIDATGKQRYLAVFIEPTLSRMAQYPNRLLGAFLVFLGGLFLWGMGTLGYYNIRGRA